MSEKTFISYEIEQDKKQGVVKIKVAIEAQTSSRDTNAAVPWQKFKTSNARAALVDRGYDVGSCVQESTMLVNAEGPVMGNWVFTDNSVPAPQPTSSARRRKTSPKTKRG